MIAFVSFSIKDFFYLCILLGIKYLINIEVIIFK